MKLKIKLSFLINLALLYSGVVCSQHILYQDVVNGGITGAGGNVCAGAGSVFFDLLLPPESTVKKAFFIAGFDQENINNVNVILNGVNFEFNQNSIATSGFLSFYNVPPTSGVCYIDITQSIDWGVSEFELWIPPQESGYYKYRPFYVIVIYEQSFFPASAINIMLNSIDVAPVISYNLLSLLPISVEHDVGFSFLGKHFCDTVSDGSYVFVNGTNIGLVGGSDLNSSLWFCSGVQGHFYYNNNTLGGLDDDIPNEIMSGSDALANISSHVNQNDVQLNLNFDYQSPNDVNGSLSNSVVATFLAYTTPCQPFETTLTEEVTLCSGDSTQLLATGGSASLPTAYEWLPQEDLSCYDCPNPMFVGDSTRHYTVRIWNTDSCSKVLPVKVLVRDTPENANLSVNAATCSEANGNMVVNSVVGGTAQYIYNIGGNNTTNPTFNNLAAGNYTLNLSDQHGCTYSQDFTIPEINPVTAAFTANPQQGTVPLNVNFTNQSIGANSYQWLVNNQVYESFNLNYTFDSAGTYPVQLITWYNEPHCADTTQQIVIAENAFSVVIPTLHAGNLGLWSIQTTNVTYAKVQIYNAIGQLIHQTEQPVSNGTNALWPAGEKATGYYFYRLKLTDVEGKEHGYEGKVLLVN